MNRFMVFIALILMMTLHSCASMNRKSGTFIGAGAGGGLGYAISSMTGMNKTGKILMTAGGALAGGIIGHEMDKAKADEQDWKQLQRESVKAGNPARTHNADGSLVVAQTMLHKPTNQYWDWVVKYGAPTGSKAPQVESEWAANWREAPEDAVQSLRTAKK